MIRCDDLALGEQRWGGWEAWVGEQRSGEPAQPDWLDEKHSPHGWRSSFSTLARDNGTARYVVELALEAYPRMRGGNGYQRAITGALEGLSPRARGKRVRQPRRHLLYGPIPASAGETYSPRTD